MRLAALLLFLPLWAAAASAEVTPLEVRGEWAADSATVRLAWTAPSTDGAPVYRIHRRSHEWPQPEGKDPIAVVEGSLEWVDEDAPQGVRLDYIVAPAHSPEGPDQEQLAGIAVVYTGTDSTAPAPPTLRSAIDNPYDSGGIALIEFEDRSPDDRGGATDVTRYDIHRATWQPTGSSPDEAPIVGSVPAGSMGWADRGAPSDEQCWYYVTATDGTNISEASNVVGPVVARANPGDRMLSLLKSVLAIMVTLGLAIAIHEFGHMGMAKRFRILVDEFAIGFGQRLFGWRRAETDYTVRLIPAGGFVRIRGMVPEEMHDPDGFYARRAGPRAAVYAAGAAMNLVLAFAIAALIAGVHSTGTCPVVDAVKPGSPAERAGILPGDIVWSVEGQRYARDLFAVAALSRRPGMETEIGILRDGQHLTVRATPEPEPVTDNQQRALFGLGRSSVRGLIGFVQAPRPYEAPAARDPGELLASAWRFTRDDTTALLRLLRDLLMGSTGVKGTVGGPIMIVQQVHIAQQAGLIPLLSLMAYLNVTLAVANLLPFPMLDGSKIVITLLEGLRGRPFNKEREAMFHLAGVVALLAFVVFVSWMDIGRLFGGG